MSYNKTIWKSKDIITREKMQKIEDQLEVLSEQGTSGVTFTPAVSAEGVISWTNDGGKTNPQSVNIKGPQGDKGDTGATGATGPAGADGANGTNGIDGADGVSPTVTVEEISTGHRVTITDANGPHSFNVLDGEGGGGSASEPHNYALDGANLKDYFNDADELWTALAQEDYSHIHLGDYWPVTLNGDYWDYGGNTVPAGTTYYSDTACETEAGTTENAIVTSAINDTAIPGGAKPYCEFKISGVTYYCKLTDTLPYAVKTLSNALMVFEAMPNHYWRYGDAGSLNFHNGRPHILFSARDGLPHTLKMRKGHEIWEDTHIAEFTGDGTTTEFTITGTVGTIGYVFVGGVRKTYNTDYTYASNKVTFKANKQPTNGALVQVEWMDGTTPWNGSALYKTFNDPDHGILHLIQQADAKLYNHIYVGNQGKGMRYYGETRTKTAQQFGAWHNRGILFLPTEDEVWDRPVHSASGLNAYCQMQQWPIYQLGGRRHFAKGAGNAASRSNVWCASSISVQHFSCVYDNGNPANNSASRAHVAAPCFIFCEAPA